jgi:hypothetical protein
MRNEQTNYPEWQAALREMQVDTDPEKLSEKLQTVETSFKSGFRTYIERAMAANNQRR